MTWKRGYVLGLILFTMAMGITACTPDPIYVGCFVNELVGAINDANANPNADIINLEAGCPYLFNASDNNMDETGTEQANNAANALPIITTKITINGNGARFLRTDAASTPDLRFFLVTSEGDLTLNEMSLENGHLFSYPSNIGGAVANYGGTLTINDVDFLHNTVSQIGGALFNQNGTVSVTNSTFSNNTANHGGAVSNQGTFDIGRNNLFENNIAESYGGAISNIGSLSISGLGDPLSLYGNSFVTNSAGVQGGAVVSGGDGSALSISRAEFTQNTSDRDGGAIHVGGEHAVVDITGSGFFANQAVDAGGGISLIGTGSVVISIDDNRFEENTSSAGGGIFIFNASVDIPTCEFNENLSSADGGAIANIGDGHLSITGGQFNLNSADRRGGGIYSDSTGSVVLEDAHLAGNTALEDGGGMHVVSGEVTISGSTIQGNQAQFGGGINNREGILTIIGDTIIEGNTAQMSGGGIGNSMGVVNVQDSIIRDNESDSGGGGISNSSELYIMTSTITGNSAGGTGGGIGNQPGGMLEVIKSTINDNTAGPNGGGISHEGALLTLLNTTVSGNEANGTSGISVNAETNIVHSTVAYNFSTGPGGAGIYIANMGNLHIKNSIVANNSPRDCYIYTTLTPTGENLDSDGTCTGFTITDDPGILPLANYGGPTKTHALDTDSPAIDAVPTLGDCSTLDNTPVGEDQRGVSRPQPPGGLCDLGAYEFDPTSPPPPPPPGSFLLKTTTDVNCRIGPHFDHVVVHTFTTGETATAIGRNEDGSWFGVAAPPEMGEVEEPWCWLPDAFVQRPFTPNDLPELDHLPSPDLLEPKLPTKEPGDSDCTGGAAACP